MVYREDSDTHEKVKIIYTCLNERVELYIFMFQKENIFDLWWAGRGGKGMKPREVRVCCVTTSSEACLGST